MIVVDTSALMAVVLGEEEGPAFSRAIFDSAVTLVAAPTAFEFAMVAHGRNLRAEARRLLRKEPIEIAAWAHDHVEIAADAFARYGKGQGRPARLNFGDCMSYALAKALDVPLLFKGGDFALTDIRPAL